MKHFILTIVSFFLLASSAWSQSLDSILTRYYSAIGGVEQLRSTVSCVVSGRYVNSSGTWKKAYTLTLKQGKMRTEMDIQAGIKAIQGYDGTMGWNISPWTGSLEPQPMNSDDSRSVALMAEMLRNDLLTYKEKGTQLIYAGTDEIDGSDCYKIVAKRNDGVTREYYLDVDSYLIVKIITKYRTHDTDHESDIYLTNYKLVNGVMMPHASEGKEGGGFYIEKFNFNVPVDDAIFMIPKKEKADDTKAN